MAAQNSGVARGAASRTCCRMKISFTTKEYGRLLELAYLGRWVVASRKSEDVPPTRRYDDISQKLFELASSLGCADLVEERVGGLLGPSAKLEENEHVREFIGEFENDTFWSELVTRLAEGDYAAEQAKRALAEAPGVEPPPTPDERLKQIEEAYWDEFEKHDLANVIVLRGGRG
jgi:hypothetical protein